jgi:5-(carboxyamino)imidazole ribonucleotide synthase
MSPRVFLPGSTIGVMGGGQLGRMFAIAARRMGYRVHAFSPEGDTPTGQLADREVAARYDDEAAVRDFARGVDVLTFEFENIPVQTIEWAAEHCTVRPAGRVLHVCQHRLREKEFLDRAGLPLPAFMAVGSAGDLAAAVTEVGLPAVLKTAAFGYDGKGQRKLGAGDNLAAAWAPFAAHGAVLEAFVPFACELSVIVARGVDGEMRTFPVGRNDHANHILDVTVLPFGDEPVERAARELACAVAEALDLVGLLAVEMFLRADGSLLINELAPRPHNSGHWSFDAAVTSQFEQQLRAVCGLPLGSTELLRPVAMANLLGDLWSAGEPDWAAAAAFPEVKIHLYGKAGPRPGRKMGHLVAFGATAEEAAQRVRAARAALTAGR